jgi:hypothetical protein
VFLDGYDRAIRGEDRAVMVACGELTAAFIVVSALDRGDAAFCGRRAGRTWIA